jgi:glyoxalase family protein
MSDNITGLHHITVISGDPQENLDFYVGVMGMRLVKKTVNQDVPGTYHLFYADGAAHARHGSDVLPLAGHGPWPSRSRPDGRGGVGG